MNATTGSANQGSVNQQCTFGSLFVDRNEFAVNVEYIQEVINAPDSYSKMPLAPNYVVGLLNLRGTIVPVLDLKKLLKFDSEEEGTGHKRVAILNYDGARVGFLLSETGEILRTRGNEICPFDYSPESVNAVIQGAIKLDNGERVLQILDPAALIEVHNLPQIKVADAKARDFARKTSRSRIQHKCISFSVLGNHLAFEITGIHEIVKAVDIDHSPMTSELCKGMMRLRGHVISIVDFATLLGGRPPGHDDTAESEQKIIVLIVDDTYVGFLVDSIESIETYSEDDVLPIPLLVRDRIEMFVGAISSKQRENILLLNPNNVLAKEEIREITSGHSRLYRAEQQEHASKKKTSSSRKSYISFEMGGHFALPILHLQEIIDLPDSLITTPGAPHYVKGMLSRRGDLIPIICGRKLYEMQVTHQSEIQKVLVVDYQKHKFGLVVDKVTSIVSIGEEQALQLRSILHNSKDSSFDEDVQHAVQLEEGAQPLFILRLDKIIGRMEGPYTELQSLEAETLGH